MANKLKIKKDDNVIVIAGRDKGVTGKVLAVNVADRRIKIQGANLVKRHTKPSQINAGGIISKEAFIDVSNVAHIDPKDGKATRVRVEIDAKGNKKRIAVRSGQSIDR